MHYLNYWNEWNSCWQHRPFLDADFLNMFRFEEISTELYENT